MLEQLLYLAAWIITTVLAVYTLTLLVCAIIAATFNKDRRDQL